MAVNNVDIDTMHNIIRKFWYCKRAKSFAQLNAVEFNSLIDNGCNEHPENYYEIIIIFCLSNLFH